MGSRAGDCRKFSANIFNKSKCSHCFKQREEHSAAALECNLNWENYFNTNGKSVMDAYKSNNNVLPTIIRDKIVKDVIRHYIDSNFFLHQQDFDDLANHICNIFDNERKASRKVSKCGYLFVAPDWDFSNPLYRTKRWQRRWFVLYDDGELTYSVDDHAETIPQASIDMNKVIEVSSAEDITGHPFSLGITSTDRVTFVKGTCSEEGKWWLNILAAFPKNKLRHKRNATYPGGQPKTIPISEGHIDHSVLSNSPPTRDKIYPEEKAQARARIRNREITNRQVKKKTANELSHNECHLIDGLHRDEKLQDIANTISTISQSRWRTPFIQNTLPKIIPLSGTIGSFTETANEEIASRDENDSPNLNTNYKNNVNRSNNNNHPQSLTINTSSTPSIVSAIVKKGSSSLVEIVENSNQKTKKQNIERGDPDGGCNIDDIRSNYLLNKNSEVNIPMNNFITNSKKGWLMKQEMRKGEWSKHWFSLNGAALFYYRDPVAEERGVLDGVLDVNSITSITETNVSRNFDFLLETWDNREIILSSTSSSTRNNWINILKLVSGLQQTDKIKISNENTKLILNNTTDDLKICEKNTKNSSNQIAPRKPKSLIFSSDEEYRTASEGGRRDSVDWGSPTSTAPSILLSNIIRSKERVVRPSSESRLNKQTSVSPPLSRRSTIDSVGSDELIVIHSVEEETPIQNAELEIRLSSAEEELIHLKDEVQDREIRVTSLLTTLEKTEHDLSKKILDVEMARDNLAFQLSENKCQAQEYIQRLTIELEDNQKIIRDLEDKLAHGIQENESLYKKIRELENSSPSSICNLNRVKLKRVDSLSDLTSVNEIDPYNLERDSLAEEYTELKLRFDKAVNEIRLMKKELKDAQYQFDTLEIAHTSLRQDLERLKINDESQFRMMAARIQDLTLKYSAAEKQVRSLKAKLTKSTEKRRSLSLKGRESFSLPKEFEDKILELENKIQVIESSKQQPAFSDGRSLKRASSRLRRKSLDNSSISNDSIQILVRLNNLETKINSQTSSESNNSSPKITDHLISRLKSLEGTVISTRDRVDQSLQHLQMFRTSAHRQRRSVSPITDKKDNLKMAEKYLLDSSKLLKDSCENCPSGDHQNIIILPENNPIKLALGQLETQLRTKLNELLKQRRILRERNELTSKKELEFLAERIAFESVCFGKLRDSIERAESQPKFDDNGTPSEVKETSQLLSLLRMKLSGKCIIKPNGYLDILSSVLARRLLHSAGRTEYKAPEIRPINPQIMEELLRQQNEINLIVMRYKNNTMDSLASGLAAETLSYISSNDAVQGSIQDAWRQAQETVNSELVQNEIAQFLIKHSERFESSIVQTLGFTLTQQDRISFEKFSDAVHDELKKGMDTVITQLTEKYEHCLYKMKSGQWMIQLEQERKASEGRQLLSEFADIVAHKALIDARITVLKGDYSSASPLNSSSDLLSSKENNNSYKCFNVQSLQKYENLFIELAEDLEISNPGDILADADFNFLFNFMYNDSTPNQEEIEKFSNSLQQLEKSILNLEKLVNPSTNLVQSEPELTKLLSICNKNYELSSQVDKLYKILKSKACINCDKIERNLIETKNVHANKLIELKNLQSQKLNSVNIELNEQTDLIEYLKSEKLNISNELEKSKTIIEKQNENLNEIAKKFENIELKYSEKLLETKDLNKRLNDELKCSERNKECLDELNSKYEMIAVEYSEFKLEYDKILHNLDSERERARKLERKLEFLENEYQQQVEEIHENIKTQILNNSSGSEDLEDEETLRSRYQREIEQLRALCEKGLAAMESSHRRIIHDLEEKHRHEIQELLSEKEQALAEETQATLAALDAMRKAHQNEVQREITRFKQEFIKQFQLGGGNSISVHRETELELDDIRFEIVSLSEKYSYKCVEAAALDEKLKLATQQIKQSQHIIQKLETRNKQLRAQLMSDDLDLSSFSSTSTSKETTPTSDVHEDESSKSNIGKKINYDMDKKESHRRLHVVEDIKSTAEYTPVYNPSSLLTSRIENSKPTVVATSMKIPTKFITPNNLNMKLCISRNRNVIHGSELLENNTFLKNCSDGEIQNAVLMDDNEISLKDSITNKLLCSPPPLNGRDVEHLKKFELEI